MLLIDLICFSVVRAALVFVHVVDIKLSMLLITYFDHNQTSYDFIDVITDLLFNQWRIFHPPLKNYYNNSNNSKILLDAITHTI